MLDVVCLGILVTDVIARPVHEYPRRGELSLVDAVSPFIGGCAANTGIGLQKMGVATGILGKVGPDGFGDFVTNTLNDHGLDTRGVVTDTITPTSATVVLVAPDGERSFIHSLGANATFSFDDIDWSVIEGAKLLHIAGHFLLPALDGAPCAQVLRRAKEMGLKTSLDTAGSPTPQWGEMLRPCLPYIDYFVPSYSEARRCLPEVPTGGVQTPESVAQTFLDAGVGVVALKMGEAGSYIRTADTELRIPPFSVRAVDATGAGDAFAAGFLAGIINGYDLEASGNLANAVGACCVQEVGTIAGLRSLPETLAFIEEQEEARKRS